MTSNRESGEGRYDIQLMPKDGDRPGYLIELKAIKRASQESLERLAQRALAQIDERKYDTDMRAKGIETIVKYGIAFSGKSVEIARG